MFATYNLTSKWQIRTAGGGSLSVGLGRILTAQAGVKVIDLDVKGYNSQQHTTTEMTLRMTLSGIQLGGEFSKDLVADATGCQVAHIQSEKDYTQLYINRKEPQELNTFDFEGPCSVVGYDVLKMTVLKEQCKAGGRTFLFIGQNRAIVDHSPDWLQRVVDNATAPTLGGNVIKFNAGNGPFSNARAAAMVEVNEWSLTAKAETNVGLWSGQIEILGCKEYRQR